MRPGARTLAIAAGALVGVGAAALALTLLPTRTAPNVWDASAIQGELVDEAAGPIRELAFHYGSGAEPIFGAIYRSFLPSLDRSTRLKALVPSEPADERAKLEAFLRALPDGEALLARTQIAVASGRISPWSKDRALVAGPAPIRLLAPAEPAGAWEQRRADWNAPMDLARAFPADLAVTMLPLDFDAGDFAITGGRLLVDMNLAAKNAGRGLGTSERLAEALGRTLRSRVTVLGTAHGDVPRHHLSMYLTPLTDGVVLVGDPLAGEAIVGAGWAPGEKSPDDGAPLVADFAAETTARFDRAAKDLQAAGFRVVRIPTVPFDDKTYFAYTNGVFETRGGRKFAWVPTFAVPRLDEAALAVYRDLGWEARPVPSRAAFPYHGTLGCLTNVLARGKAED